MTETRMARYSPVFLVLLVAEFVSVLGSSMSGFGMGVWVFQRTGSATEFAFAALFVTLPGLLVAPFAGALVDRYDRRYMMILGDSGAALGTVLFAVLLWLGRLEPWHVYVINGAVSIMGAFLGPAFASSISMLVRKDQFARASGMFQFVVAVSQIAAPLLAGLLLGFTTLPVIFAIDFATFGFMIAVLLAVRIPKPPVSKEGRAARGSLLKEAASGWHYLRAHRGLFNLLVLVAAYNLATGAVYVLVTPLILSFSDTAALGAVSSAAGIGLVAGGLLMSVWGGPKRKMAGIYGGMLVAGAVLLFAGLRPNVLMIGLGAACFLAMTPVINACSAAIWQSKIPPDLQGRVFAMRLMIGWSTLPLAYAIAGPLADRVFEPAMAEGGALASSIGALIGTGPGRGIALFMILSGLTSFVVTVFGILNYKLRRVELDEPDYVPEPVVDAAPKPVLEVVPDAVSGASI